MRMSSPRLQPRTPLSERPGWGPKQPIRTCIGCRSHRGQDQLIRLHLDAGGRLQIDRTGPGRGAWICLDKPVSCLTTAVERRALDRAMRRSVERSSIDAVLAAFDGRKASEVESSA